MDVSNREATLANIIEYDFIESAVFDEGATHFHGQVFLGAGDGNLSFFSREGYLEYAAGGFVFGLQGNVEGTASAEVKVIVQGLIGIFPGSGKKRGVEDFIFFFFCWGGIAGVSGDGIYLCG